MAKLRNELPRPHPQHSRPIHAPSSPTWESVHAELLEDEASWQRLPFLGYQTTQDGIYEVRNCSDCGSSLYRPVTAIDEAIAAHSSRVDRERHHLDTLLSWKGTHKQQR